MPTQDEWDDDLRRAEAADAHRPGGPLLWDSQQNKVIGNVRRPTTAWPTSLVASAGADVSHARQLLQQATTFDHHACPKNLETLAPCDGDRLRATGRTASTTSPSGWSTSRPPRRRSTGRRRRCPICSRRRTCPTRPRRRRTRPPTCRSRSTSARHHGARRRARALIGRMRRTERARGGRRRAALRRVQRRRMPAATVGTAHQHVHAHRRHVARGNPTDRSPARRAPCRSSSSSATSATRPWTTRSCTRASRARATCTCSSATTSVDAEHHDRVAGRARHDLRPATRQGRLLGAGAAARRRDARRR